MRVANVLLFLLLTFAAAGVRGEPTLERIRASGVVRLGFLESAPPFSYSKNGKSPEGYSIELCNRVVDAIGQQLRLPSLRREWVKVTFQDRLAAVKEGRVDLDCGTTTWTLSRQEGVDFSLMTFIDGGSLLVRLGDGLVRLTDFVDKSIAVVPGTTTSDVLPRELKRRGVAARVVPARRRVPLPSGCLRSVPFSASASAVMPRASIFLSARLAIRKCAIAWSKSVTR